MILKPAGRHTLVEPRRARAFPTFLAVRVSMDLAHEEAIHVEQRSWRLRVLRQGLPTAAHPLHGPGGVGVAQAVAELGEGLPQLLLVPVAKHTHTHGVFGQLAR